MDLELKKQINIVEQRLQYHFGSTLKGYEIPKGMPFMKEVLADIDKLCEMARSVNTSASGLTIPVVSQQRELLIAYEKTVGSMDINEVEKEVDRYLEGIDN